MTVRAFHFLRGNKLRDGTTAPSDGEWLQFGGKCVMCESGLHASLHPFDALQYAPGETLCLVECDGIADEQSDKLVCSRRRIIARFDATDLLWEMSRWCALQVIHLWDAPQIVRDYLTTGDESLRAAAWDAARAAARAAAWEAAGATAWDAAWHAARAAAGATAGDAAWHAARAAAVDAAGDAAWHAAGATARAAAVDAQKAHFAELVTAKFRSMGIEP
jgi:hypothetical protein